MSSNRAESGAPRGLPVDVASSNRDQPRCGCYGVTMVSGRTARLLAPFEDVLAEGEVAIEDESGEDVVDLTHAANPEQPSAVK